jgi:hypothetical protein
MALEQVKGLLGDSATHVLPLSPCLPCCLHLQGRHCGTVTTHTTATWKEGTDVLDLAKRGLTSGGGKRDGGT